MQKSQIYYHRSHRKISCSWEKFISDFLLFIPPCWFLILFFYPLITRLTSQYLIDRYASLYPASTPILVKKAFMLGSIITPEIPGRYPSPQFTFVVFLFTLLFLFIAAKIPVPKPVAYWMIFVCLVNLVSVLFFTFFAPVFPYTIRHFSELFIKTEISIWLFVPVIMVASLSALPSSKRSKFVAILSTLIYAVAFGTVRYVLFVSILVRFSYIFMAVLFFCFGPFIDFITVVGTYSFYVSCVSRKINQDMRVWNWS
jgi:hypothetical protein